MSNDEGACPAPALPPLPQDKPGLRVGVIGLGGLGHMAVQFARAFGCEVGPAPRCWLLAGCCSS